MPESGTTEALGDPQRRWYRKKRFTVPVVVLGGLLILTALVDDDEREIPANAGLAAASTESAKASATGSSAAPAPTRVLQAVVPTPPPTLTPQPTAKALVDGEYRLVANTGGVGVAVRDACDNGAKTGGSLAEGAEVQLLFIGQGSCMGWYVVAASEIELWVRADYLEPTPAPSPTPRPLTAPLILERGHGCNRTGGGGFFIYEGQVTNNTRERLENVEVVATYFTDNGTFVTSDSALVDFNPMLPGQSSPFSVYTTFNPAIARCAVEFKEFFGGTIRHQRREN